MKAPESLDVQIYFPGSGVYRGEEVYISPRYDGRDTRGAAAGSSLGDLALIRLDGNAHELPAKLGPIVEGQSRAVVGFGQFVLTTTEGIAIGVPPGPYLAGAGVTSVPRFLEECAGKQVDTVCAQYVTDMREFKLSSALCAGDSGGGVFERAPGPPRLLAVSSRRLELRTEVECAEVDSVQSVFTRTDAHDAWIRRTIGTQPNDMQADDPYVCEDLLFSSKLDQVSTLTTAPVLQRRAVTITAVNFKIMQGGRQLAITAPSPACAPVANRSDLVRCELQPMAELAFTVGGPGLVQVTHCLRKE